MDFILISSEKLKIMLTPEDISVYSLTFDNINYDSTETRRAFWNILDTAKHKTGFDAANNRINIQIYSSINGGCEMYLTKLIKREETTHRYYVKKCDEMNSVSSSPVSLTIDCKIPKYSDYNIYSFNELYHLLNACRQLKLNGYNGSSNIWIDDSNLLYYLAIEKGIQYIFLDEYGTMHHSPVTYTYINEHCRCICEDGAIETMAALV